MESILSMVVSNIHVPILHLNHYISCITIIIKALKYSILEALSIIMLLHGSPCREVDKKYFAMKLLNGTVILTIHVAMSQKRFNTQYLNFKVGGK